MTEILWFFGTIFISFCIWLIGYAVGYSNGLNKNVDEFIQDCEYEEKLKFQIRQTREHTKHWAEQSERRNWIIWKN